MLYLFRIGAPLLAAVLGGGVSAASHQQPEVDPQPKLVQDFQIRVKDYVKLRDAATENISVPKQSKDPEEIESAQEAMSARIRAARPNAKQGDVFSPEIAQYLKSLVRTQTKGQHGAETKGAIKDVQPSSVKLKVNTRYPDDEPTPMVPPNVLLRLPRLPDGLEYRVIRDALVLLDTQSNLIVDFIPNVM